MKFINAYENQKVDLSTVIWRIMLFTLTRVMCIAKSFSGGYAYPSSYEVKIIVHRNELNTREWCTELMLASSADNDVSNVGILQTLCQVDPMDTSKRSNRQPNASRENGSYSLLTKGDKILHFESELKRWGGDI